MTTTQDSQYTTTGDRHKNSPASIPVELPPAFQIYPKDWITDSRYLAMSPEVRGLYLHLIFIDWIGDGFPAHQMSVLSGYQWHDKDGSMRDAEDHGTAMALLSECFEPHPSKDGYLSSPRLQAERKKQELRRAEKSEAGKKGAKSKWNKGVSTDGTAILLPSVCHRSANGKRLTNDGSSSSSSSSIITTEGSTIVDPSSVTPSRIKPEKISIAPKLSMTKEQAQGLVEEFGRESCEYYKKICSDYLLSKGKTMKDAAAFMRNWIRREIAERKGFYYPKQNGYRPHTAASMAEKNLEYIRKMEGKSDGSEDVAEMFGSLFDDKKELGSDTDGGRSLVPLVEGPKR